MTQEEKRDILLKDLCGRLPYGVKASYYGAEEECELERDLFPEVTFENSPQEVEIKLVK